jgi:hypothetical protein
MSKGVRWIGVVGTGRLGKVLASRLSPRFSVAAYDCDVRKAKQFCKQVGITFLYPDELARESDLILLCLPGDQVLPWLLGPGSQAPAGVVFVNLATELPTSTLVIDPRLTALAVVGLKPVAQFMALECGLPGLFVTDTTDSSLRETLAAVFASLGRVVAGDEAVVGAINREATAAALRFCAEWTGAVTSATPDLLDAALKNVVVGTILDYPPDPGNGYTNRILDAIRGAGAAEAVGGVA